MKTAIQLYTLRREAADDLEGTLAAVKNAGYDGVELAGLYGRSGEEMKALLDKYGLVPISAHIGLNSTDEQTLSEYEKIGIKYAVVPMTRKPTENTKSELLAEISGAADKFSAHGFIPGYHNHTYEFEICYGGRPWHDYVMDAIPSAVAELDLCWLEVGGGDAVKLVNNLLLGCNMAALAEALALGVKCGLSVETMRDVISVSSGKSYVLDAKLEKFIMADAFDGGFAVDLQYKDLGLALEASRDEQVPLPMTATAVQVYEAARAKGQGRQDMSSVVKLYEDLTGAKIRG